MATMEPEVPAKSLDANRYATKKTIAQGMLDIALLTANASQLKYILQVGPRHEFYSLMLGLISTSMVLQVALGVLFLSLNVMRDCRLHQQEYHRSALLINYVSVGGCVLVTALNLLASGLDPGLAVLVGVLFLVIGAMNINKERDKRRADILNDVILILVFIISVTNVVIAGFGIDNICAGALSMCLAKMSVEDREQHRRAKALYLVAVGCIMLAMTADVVKMGFGLDPALPYNASLRYYEP